MINKKFASAVGLGATAIGAAGSTMTSANLFDLLKNDKKAQDEYLKETIKVRNRAVAKNIIKEMLRLLNYGSNNTSDLIEKLKDAVDSKKNIPGASENIDDYLRDSRDYSAPTNIVEEKWREIHKNKTFKVRNNNNNININNINDEEDIEDIINNLYDNYDATSDIVLDKVLDRAEKNLLSEKQVIKFLIENTMVKVIEDGKEETKIFRETKTFKDLFVPQNEVAERNSIIDYTKICIASDYCCELLSKGKKLSTAQFEAVKGSFDDDNFYSLFTEGVRGDDLLIHGISNLYNDNQEELTIEYLKDKEKNAIKDFYEKTCFGRVIFLNELNYDIKLSSTLNKIALEGVNTMVSKVIPIKILNWIAGRFTAFGTKTVENKINKLHDKLQPQLDDSLSPSVLDTIKEAYEGSL